MGSGKTTVGRKLSSFLGYDFVDIDQELVARTGVSIAHIFEVEGEQGFRERETKLLRELCQRHNTVVSTGGGVIGNQENTDLMRQHGTVIFLDVPLRILWNRLKDCQHRPLLQVANPRQKVIELMEQRGPLYRAAADIRFEVSSDSATRTARKIQQSIESKQT
jgi:shikimate kinase